MLQSHHQVELMEFSLKRWEGKKINKIKLKKIIIGNQDSTFFPHFNVK